MKAPISGRMRSAVALGVAIVGMVIAWSYLPGSAADRRGEASALVDG